MPATLFVESLVGAATYPVLTRTRQLLTVLAALAIVTEAIEPRAQGGIVLTLMPEAMYDTRGMAFEPGDRLLIYTDGLTEASRDGSDEVFGDAELGRVVTSTTRAQDLLHTVLDAHRRWIGEGTPVSDDISVVVVECLD